jgi:hypothetical protein
MSIFVFCEANLPGIGPVFACDRFFKVQASLD